jgi:hypothetical protein
MSENTKDKDSMIDYLRENYKKGGNGISWREIGQNFGFEAEQARKIWLNYRQKNYIEDKFQPSEEVHEATESFNPATYQSNWSQIQDADKIINGAWQDESMLVLNLPDLHLDKLDITGSSIEDNIDNYFKVLKNLLSRAYHSANVKQITLVLGNDLFNTDTVLNTTTNGTIQRCNTTWDVAYEKIYDAMVQTIALCSKFCDHTHVVLVQGNHDKSKSYYMVHGLQQYFRNDNKITFDRANTTNKAVVWGSSFIGFNHGNNINDKLPLDFAQEFYKEWGQCKYHDIYVGDKHHNNEKVFRKKQMQDEKQGVRLRILPSLSKPDSWHDENLYKSRQSGIAILYDKDRGKSAEFECQL